MMFQPGMMRLAKGSYRPLALCVGLGFSLSGVAIWRGFLTADVIDRVFAGESFNSMINTFAGILALALLIALFSWLRRGAEMWAGARVRQTLRTRLFHKLAELGPGYAETQGSAKLQAATVDGVEAMEGYFGSYVPQVLVTLVAPTAILIYLFTLDVWVGLVLLAAILTALFGPKLWDRLLGKYGKEHWDSYASLNSRFIDSMQGMTTLVTFNAADRGGQELKEKATSLYRATMRQLAVSLMNSGVVGLAMKGGSAAALGVAAVRMSQGHLSLEALLIVLFLAGECIGPLSDLDRAWHAGYMGVSASSGILEILDKQPDVKPLPFLNIKMRPPEIAFENISFSYPGREHQVLKSVSMTLKAGQTTAVAGPSGAGKSTAAALLLRFYDGDGRITIDGADISDISLHDLRGNIALVSQDPYLFYGSVTENLRLAKPEATLEDLQRAAKAARAHDFIAAMPEGYDTIIGERGQKLSGGEKQRLAIARALLKDAPILILDEATAAVDAANEALIQEALANATHKRTTLVIAHRLNTISSADNIYVFDDGQIVESGKHSGLIQQDGLYARLATAMGATS